MMRVAAVIDRLKTRLVNINEPILRNVLGAGLMPSIPTVLKFTNTAYVLPKGDYPGDNTSGTMDVSQRTRKTVSVLIGFVRMNQRKIGDLDSVEDVTEAVKAALVGWLPPGEQSPVIYGGGGIAFQDLETGILIWGADYVCPYYVEN
jgi:hypothetical protein